jgi:purine-binding chemotaxis protein CheW
MDAIVETAQLSLVNDQRHEYLSINLGREEYGINLHNVQEIRNYETATQIANLPIYIKGVINLRGIIVPIIDLRVKFSIGEARYDHLTIVVILNIAGKYTGIVVDSVSDVVNLDADQIKPAPLIDGARDVEYLLGLATIDERMLILVDIAKMISSNDLHTMQLATEIAPLTG